VKIHVYNFGRNFHSLELLCNDMYEVSLLYLNIQSACFLDASENEFSFVFSSAMIFCKSA